MTEDTYPAAYGLVRVRLNDRGRVTAWKLDKGGAWTTTDLRRVQRLYDAGGVNR